MLNVSRLVETVTKTPLYRKHSPTHVLCFTVALAILQFLTPCDILAQQIDSEVARFVGEVAIGSEYSKKDLVTMKWGGHAQLSIFGGEPSQTRVIDRCVRRLNKALADTEMRIEMLEPNDENATLKVYLAEFDDFETIIEREKISYIGNNDGCFYIRWDSDYHISSAVVLLAIDRLQDDELRHFAMEEITQTLGLPGDSPRFENSLFYEAPERGEFGSVEKLSKLDAKLLRFLYQQVEPGTHAVELGILMAKRWADAR